MTMGPLVLREGGRGDWERGKEGDWEGSRDNYGPVICDYTY